MLTTSRWPTTKPSGPGSFGCEDEVKKAPQTETELTVHIQLYGFCCRFVYFCFVSPLPSGLLEIVAFFFVRIK